MTSGTMKPSPSGRITNDLAVIFEIAKKFTERLTEDEVLQFICEKSVELLQQAPNLSVSLRNKLTDQLRLFVFREGTLSEVEDLEEQQQIFDQTGRTKIEEIIRTGKPILLSTRETVKERAESDREQAFCWLGVPMNIRSGTIGAVVTYHTQQEHFYNDEDKLILDRITDQAATALNSMRLDRRNQLLRMVEKELLDRQFGDEEQVLGFVFQKLQVFQEIDTRKLSIVLQNRKTKRLRAVLSDQKFIPPEDVEPQLQAIEHIGREKIEWILEHQSILMFEEGTWITEPDETTVGWWVGVPMRLSKRAIGVFVTFHPEQKPIYTKGDADILDTISDKAASAIENVRLSRRLKKLANIKKELSLHRQLTIEQVLEIVSAQAQYIADTYNLCIILHDEATDKLRLARVYRKRHLIDLHDPAQKQEIWDKMPKAMIHEILETKKPRLLADKKQVQRAFAQQQVADRLPATWLGVPMRLKNKTIGVFAIYHMRYENVYDDDDTYILDDLSDQAAIAIDNARLSQRSAVMAEIEKELASGIRLTEEEILELIGQQTQKLQEINTRNLAVILYQRVSGKLVCSLAFHNGQLIKELLTEKVQRQLLHHLGEKRIKWIVENSEPLLWPGEDNTQSHKLFTADEEYASWVGVPMRLKDRVIGTFVTYHESRADAYTQEDVLLLDRISDQAAIALDNVRLAQRLRTLSDIERDMAVPLTEDREMSAEDEILQWIYQKTQEFGRIDTSNLSIIFHDKATGQLKVARSFQEGKPTDVANDETQHRLLRFLGKDRIERIVEKKEPLILTTKKEVRAYFSDAKSVPYASWVGVPMRLRSKNEVIGVFVTYHRTREHVYNEDDVYILDALSDQAATMLDSHQMTQRLMLQSKRRAALVTLGQELSSDIALTEEQILQLVYENATELIDINTMYVALFEAENQTIRFGVVYQDGVKLDVNTSKKYQPRQIDEGGRTEWILRNGSPLSLKTRAEIEAWYQEPGHQKRPGTSIQASWMAVPMSVGDDILGVIGVSHQTEEQKYDAEDLVVLYSMADQAAVTLLNSRLFLQVRQQLGQRISDFQILQGVYEAIGKESFQQVRQLIIEKIITLTDADYADVWLYNAQTQELEFDVEFPGRREEIIAQRGIQRLHIDQKSIIARAAKDRQTYLCPDVTQDEWYVECLANVQSELAVPLRYHNELIGVLNFESDQLEAFPKEHQRLVEVLAGQAAIAIYNARLYEHLRERTKESQESQRQVENIIESLPDATFVVDQNGIVKYWNRAIEEMTGVPSEQMIEKGDYEYARPFYGERRPLLIDLVGDKKLRKQYKGEYDYFDEPKGDVLVSESYNSGFKQGPLYDHSTASLLRDSHNNIVGAIEIISDITELKKVEEALKESKERLSKIVDFLPYPTFAIDRDGKVTFWNQAIEEMTGVPADDIIDKGNYEYAIPFYGKRRALLIDLLQKPDQNIERQEYENLSRTHDSLEAETIVTIKAKKIHVFSKAALLYDSQGNPDGAIETIVDITKRRQADKLKALNERQKALIDLAHTLASSIRLTEKDILHSIHKNASALMDTANMHIALYDEETDMIRFPLVFRNNKPLTTPSRQVATGKGLSEEIIRTKSPVLFQTKTELNAWYTPHGHLDYTNTSELACWLGAPMLIGDKVLGVVATYHSEKENVYTETDLVEILQSMANLASIALENARLYQDLEQRNQQLKEAQAKVAASERAMVMNRLSAEFAHRMNNLAAVIPVQINLAKESLTADISKEHRVFKHLARVTDDVQQLLNASREIRQTTKTSELVQILITELVELSLNSVLQSMSEMEQRIKIQRKFAKNLPTIYSEKDRLQATIDNIIRNAIEAMQAGGTLTVTCKRGSLANCPCVDMIIEDTGVGIPTKELPKIFDVFYTTKESGLGLGLWRDRAFIKEIGGDIEVDSEEGEGSTFIIKIPIERR